MDGAARCLPSGFRNVQRALGGLALVASLLALPSAGGAAEQVSNLGGAYATGYDIGDSIPALTAIAFTTDSSPYRLDSVTLKLWDIAPGANTGYVALYSHGGLHPGDVLEVLPPITTGPEDFGFDTFSTPSSGTILAPDTTYWIVGGVASGGGNSSIAWVASSGGSTGPRGSRPASWTAW